MIETSRELKVLHGIDKNAIPFDELFAGNQPVLMKNVVHDWPLVQAGKTSSHSVMDMLSEHDSGKPVIVYQGESDIKARFGYSADYTGLNYTAVRSTLTETFDKIATQLDQDEHDFLYINSLRLDQGFPLLAREHSLTFNHPDFERNTPLAKIWLGTESVAAAHFDQPRNIACCVQGKRRFTLYPPEQIHNLYPGPMNLTPGGQVVSVIDPEQDNDEIFPKFARAREAAIVVDLEPGDALYYPSLWWHEVQALERFNVMINFWWRVGEPFLGNPMDALMHAILSVRDLPEAEKAAWKHVFEYYIFNTRGVTHQHLPKVKHDPIVDIDDNTARQLRAVLLKNLNR